MFHIIFLACNQNYSIALYFSDKILLDKETFNTSAKNYIILNFTLEKKKKCYRISLEICDIEIFISAPLSSLMLRVIPLAHTELRKSLKAEWHNNHSLVCEYFLCLLALNTGWLEWEKRGSCKITLLMPCSQSPDWHFCFTFS